MTLDVKDAYLMCDQPRKVKITLEKALAQKLNLPQEWILGKVLPGQREGAAEWFQNLRSTLKAAKLVQCMEAPTVWTNSDRTMAILVHVDDMVVTGTDDTVKELIQCLHGQYKIAVEEGDQLTFLKRSIEVTEKEIHIKVNNKYLEGLVNLLGGVRKKKTPGEQIVDETPLTSERDIKVYRSCVGTLLYISGDRPDVQFHVKELAGKLQCPTRGAMKTLENVVGYLAGTMDFHVKMTSKNPAQSFRCRAKGVTTAPFYEEDPTCWLLEVATDSDWSGNKLSRSSTSCGCVFLGGIWIYSYSRTQRNITLSSTESEFVALVSGACEGLLLRAVLQHLVGENVQLKLYGDNTSCMAIAAKEGVCKVKHLSGRLLWIQQRQGRDFQLRRLDTTTNVADAGTKALPGRRMRFLLYLMGFTDDWEELGIQEFNEEKTKKESREQLKSIRKVVHSQVLEADQSPSSTLMNKLAKRLMKLTLGALLVESGEALGPSSSPTCYVVAESTSSSWTVFFLALVIVTLMTTVGILLKIMHVMHKKIEITRNAMDWLRMKVRERRMRVRIRAQEQARTGIYLESEGEEESEEEKIPIGG